MKAPGASGSISSRSPTSTRQEAPIICRAKALASFEVANRRNLQPDRAIEPQGENLANLTKCCIVNTGRRAQL